MSIVNVYYSTQPSMNYVFKAGTVAHFVGGRFFTDKKSQVEEMDAEIEAGNPYLYVKKDELTLDSKLLDPVEALKARLRIELLKEMQAGPTPMDLGKSTKMDVMAGAMSSADVPGGVKVGPIVPKK